MDEDNTLTELQQRIGTLKDQRTGLLNDLVSERRETELMQSELNKMKKEKTYLEGLIKEKMNASREYDRIIAES